MVQHAHHQEEKRDDCDEGDQRRLRARGQHPVVDLEHEQRPGQHQQVHEHAEQTAGEEEPAAFRQCLADFPVAVPALRHRRNTSHDCRKVRSLARSGIQQLSFVVDAFRHRSRPVHHGGATPMRLMFLHNNFPAQFGALARYMSQRGHDVTFGTSWQGTPPDWLRMVRYRPHRTVGKRQHPYLAFVESAVLNGQALARVAWKMKDEGYSPDLVVAHSGWGPGLYVRDIWPDAKYLGYFEWYYRSKGADLGFIDAPTRDDEHRIRTRNAAILLDLAACNRGIVPTAYQASQFPELFRRKLTVQHDGVDTDYSLAGAGEAPEAARARPVPRRGARHLRGARHGALSRLSAGNGGLRRGPAAQAPRPHRDRRRGSCGLWAPVAERRHLPEEDAARARLRPGSTPLHRAFAARPLSRGVARVLGARLPDHPLRALLVDDRGDERRLSPGRIGHRTGARGRSRRREWAAGRLLRHRAPSPSGSAKRWIARAPSPIFATAPGARRWNAMPPPSWYRCAPGCWRRWRMG